MQIVLLASSKCALEDKLSVEKEMFDKNFYPDSD